MAMVNHYKMSNSHEWVMQFSFDPTIKGSVLFNEIYKWFDDTFSNKDEVWMGWATNRTSLTVFFNCEKSYTFSILKWS